jgi:tetratricopeptide (TPR) repeat protein
MLPATKALLQAGLLLGLLSLLSAVPVRAQTPTPPSPIASPSPAPADLGALRSEMEDTLGKAKQMQDFAQSQTSTILGVIEVFLGFLAVVLTVAGVIGFIGFREQRQIREQVRLEIEESTKQADAILKAAEKARSNVEEAYQTAKGRLDEAVSMAEEHVRRIGDWRAGLLSAWSDIDTAFQQLPFLESEEVDGLAPPPLPIKISATFEDADVVLMLCDQLKIAGEREKNWVYFLRLAQYWRIAKNYPRALSRAERAVELAPQNADVHLTLAKTLAHWADGLPVDSLLRREAVQQALREIDTVVMLQGKEDVRSLHERAWALDTQGEFIRAAAIYKDAREEDRKEAALKGREERWYLTYNRGCSLAKAGQVDESLTEISLFLEKWPERWPAVKNDPDLEALRSSSPWKERLTALIEDAKSRRKGGS